MFCPRSLIFKFNFPIFLAVPNPARDDPARAELLLQAGVHDGRHCLPGVQADHRGAALHCGHHDGEEPGKVLKKLKSKIDIKFIEKN